MKNPSRHWVTPIAFEHYSRGHSRAYLCRLLRRCDRTIRDWQSGRRPIPAWTIDALRMNRLETAQAYRDMFGTPPPGIGL